MVRAVFSTSATFISASSTTSVDPIVPPVSCEMKIPLNSKYELSRQKELDGESSYVAFEAKNGGRKVYLFFLIYIIRLVKKFHSCP